MGENTMKRGKKKVPELPEEIIHDEILMRLPIKYVVRFKTVSKYWQSKLSATKFVKQHLIRSTTQNPNDHDYLIAKKYYKIFMLSRYKETYLLPSSNYQLIGSVNGLICLGSGEKLALWNPAIHQSKEFTLPPSRDYNYYYDMKLGDSYNMGLGYDAANDVYKVVVLSADMRSASVYKSNVDSWFDITVVDNMFSENALEEWTPTTIVKNCTYWTCSRVSSNVTFFSSLGVVKFDVTRDDFKLLPDFRSDILTSPKNQNLHYKFVDVADHLALVVLDRSSTDCMVDIYALEGEEEGCAWIKMQSMGPIDFGRLMDCTSVLQGFKYGGEIVFCCHGVISCYDCNKSSETVSYLDKKSGAIKQLEGSASTYYSYVSCFRYMPTLACVQGMKSVHSTTQSRTYRRYWTPRRLISSLRN